MDEDYRIIQIIPAQGWYANFRQQDHLYQSPVICWALIQDDDLGYPIVIGLLPLERSRKLWLPNEIEDWFSSGVSTEGEYSFHFVEYSQVAQKNADLPPNHGYLAQG